MSQKLCQKVSPDHEMSDLFTLQCPSDFVGICGGTNRAQKISRQFAAVMKIISLAIIRPPADKEKINFRRRRRAAIDVLKRRVFRQVAAEIFGPTFDPAQITERRGFRKIIPEVDPVPRSKNNEPGKQKDRPPHAQISIEDTIHRQNDQRRHDRKNVTDSQVHEKHGVQ